MVMVGAYLLNLLCAMVPCQGTLPPPEAYIESPANINNNNDLTREARSNQFKNSTSESVFFSTRMRNSWKRETNTVSDDDTVVTTDRGTVRGYPMGTMKGRRIVAFEGIPFAKPPVGELRFRSPVEHERWSGVLDTKRPGSPCLQAHPLHFFRISGNENCLFMNVYTPNTAKSGGNKTTYLPVLVFIHGGSFMYGHGGEYGPAYLLDQDILLVTFNYRLGALGFLSTLDEASPGNYGLKDQHLALKFISNNIKKFGGDPKRVTIMGQSAGGVSAHLHAISGKSKNYYQSGVSLSGSAFGYWQTLTAKRARMWTKRLAKRLRCDNSDSRILIKCLRTVSASFIAAAEQQIFDWIPFQPLVMFAPVVEPPVKDAYITKSAEAAYTNQTVDAKPWIFAFTAEEGHFETYLIKLFMQASSVLANPQKYLPLILDYVYSSDLPTQSKITEDIITFYKKNDSDKKVSLDTISEMYTDSYFAMPASNAVEVHSEIAPTYGYIFDFKGRYNLGTLFGVQQSEWGKSHTEDLFYFFNSSVFHHGLQKKDPEYKLSEIMVNTLANFVTAGTPSYVDSAGQVMRMWEVAKRPTNATFSSFRNREKLRFLQFQEEIKMIDLPSDKVEFWNHLRKKYSI